ncbi:c-type cytochrome [Dyella subtropica]|uniref:c-type cytochrome n=1 Tax=Dyella subtropica TaxID=2992127 RepID=UPI002250872F|nr:c-type cytochrome [Dyella subtropica]
MTSRTSLLLACLLMSTVVPGVNAQQPAASTFAAPTSVLDLRRMQPISGDAKAGAGKAAVCAACHGAQGVAIAPNFPNLAGQSATYLYVQLKEFHDSQRTDPVMTGQATALSDDDMRDLASYYASLTPKPAGQADTSSRGAQLYLAGDPTQGIPPCQACHGPAGLGPQPHPSTAPQPPWATFPHLRGQSGLYLTKQLDDFKRGTRAGSSNAKVMHGVAQTLSDEDMQALASYLSSW